MTFHDQPGVRQVGATGQIFSGMDEETGKEVAIKMVRGIYRSPRTAQNMWREVRFYDAHDPSGRRFLRLDVAGFPSPTGAWSPKHLQHSPSGAA